MPATPDESVSAIIPTLGRADMLDICLHTLCQQTQQVSEVLIVHCGEDEATRIVAEKAFWKEAGVDVKYFHYPEKNAAQQRHFAITRARYDNLLLLDDDVELEPRWVAELFKPLWADSNVGATMGRLVNQPLAQPTLLWRIYRVLLLGSDGLAPGRVVGAALPNGFPTDAMDPIPCEWIGGGCSALRREAYLNVGGFASFFTGSSPGEDIDLGYRLSRRWLVLYVPTARCIHHQAAGNREKVELHQFLSMRARFGILYSTMKKGRLVSLCHITLWALVQNMSELAALRKGGLRPDLARAWYGRFKGWLSCLAWTPSAISSPEGIHQRHNT